MVAVAARAEVDLSITRSTSAPVKALKAGYL